MNVLSLWTAIKQKNNAKQIFYILLILIELIGLMYVGYIFWLNRFDKDIFRVVLNTIFVSLAYTFLRALLSSSFPRVTLVRVTLFGMAMFIIFILAFTLAFWVNLDNKKESDDFYIYFFYNKANRSLLCLNRFHSESPYIAATFNNLTQADRNIKIDGSFFQDYLDIAIIKTFGMRYRTSWFIKHETLPLTTVSRWGPKEITTPVKSVTIKADSIVGYKENRLIEKFKTQGLDDIITVPAGTQIYIDTFPKEQHERISIKNKYCTIMLVLFPDNVLTGDFVTDIKGPYDTKGLLDSNLEVFVFKAKYHILYNRLRMGSSKFLNYYKPWADDVVTFFQNTFDVTKSVTDKADQYLMQIRGNTPQRLLKD
ncbi:MAG: hypothetical protein KKD11_07810 [Candidatus Omnitrophica bacterium]|nr:hypothetical protein [Candidatus Omnitrophota bacterium]